MSASGIKTDSSSPYLSSSIRRAGSFLPLSFGSQRAQLDSGNTLKHKALIGVASFVTVLSLSLGVASRIVLFDGDEYQNMLDLLHILRFMGIALPGPSGQGYWATPSG